jgi:hypothetical protein
MNRLSVWWHWVVNHQTELWIGAVFGAFFALIFDLVSVDSRIRAGIRHIKNKLSEQSVSRLRKRIEQLEAQRNRYASYLSSDKALYLVTLQGLLLAVICMAFGAACAGIADISRNVLFKLWSIAFYGGAIPFGFMGIRFALLDSRAKVAKVVEKFDSELLELKTKLGDKTK